MSKWSKHIVFVNHSPIKVFINASNTMAVLFFPYGRYVILRSDISVLDFATDFLLGSRNNSFVSHSAYLSSLEDTAVIQIETMVA